MHLVITDSGLGGLAVCAAAAKAFAESPGAGQTDVRITYFNCWPEERGGYNDMPDIAARARVFDRALAAMAALRPDRIVIACNTLSVVYGHTAVSRVGTVPVLGIVDAGVDLFFEALAADPRSSIALFGTRTTIGSNVHRARLIEKGIAPGRIAAVACHGLARAIEMDPDGGAVASLIDRCTTAAGEAAPDGTPLHFGVCCTHYTYVRDEMRAALERRSGRPVRELDPGDRLVGELMRLAGREDLPTGRLPTTSCRLPVSVTVVSKVEMDDRKRESMARRVEAASPATAAALLSYTRVPDLF